ncbi:hypothetical protein AMA15_004094 [Salmonella enterica subsp. enterica serovar Newington]|nr:hypothetical protein [Salmonella enterica subsp. enterica serovar Newington]
MSTPGGVSSRVNIDRPGHRPPSHSQKKSPSGGCKHVNSAEAEICSRADVRDVSEGCGYKGGIF